MVKLIFKFLLLFILICFFPLLIWLTICPQYTTGYGGSVPDKVRRLESLNSPKIILCGNSNVAFGFNSKLLEENIGMPVVNMGYHAGVGNAVNERLALFNISKGDIVVLSQLSYEDGDDEIANPELALLTFENYFHLLRVFHLKDYPRLIQSFPRYTYKCLYRFLYHKDKVAKNDTVWSKAAFNEYGDIEYARPATKDDIAISPLDRTVGKKSMERIAKFADYCKKRGATLVIAAPPFLKDEKINNLEKNDKFWSDLKIMAKCPVISDNRDYIYDLKYFYDTSNHLTDEGARLRTEQLTKDLKKFLENR